MLSDIINYFPESIKNTISDYVKKNNIENYIEEIRFRTNKNLNLKVGQELVLLNYIINSEEMEQIFENICEKSIYAYTKQISEGYITIKGGNRVGITGSTVIENGKIINLNYISSLNFRISRQIEDVSNSILKYVLDFDNNTIFNTIIASPPGGRKNNNVKRFGKKNIRSEFQK